ncbi:MAG: LeuA family protein [Acidobacteriota bacterium]|nr:LeuA family protein [Blastocatellia bacterium]MDW8240727.1 LeuA family protein [Acidobacteriota bacterium]
MNQSALIYDWNAVGGDVARSLDIEFDDETLRDGLQSPSVRNPTIEQKLEILHLMAQLGIEAADVGLPGAGPHVVADVTRLVKEIADARLPIKPNCAARTVRADILPIIEISQATGLALEVAAFIGSSPIRQYVEDWPLDMMLRATEEAVSLAVKNGLSVSYVTEDTTRAHPDTLRRLYKTAIECGAYRVVIADTVGHATPRGAAAVVSFIKRIIAETGEPVKVDWHGHNDRGLGVINAIAAIEAGAQRVHATALGIGERCGNVPMDQLLINLQLMGYIDRDLSKLLNYCQAVSRACGVPIPCNYPALGRDAFRTATGVHAAAVIKAYKKRDAHLANIVYSGVPAHLFGLEQIIEIGPVSGRSNVIYWLAKRGIEPTEERVGRIFDRAKRSTTVLTEEEVLELV